MVERLSINQLTTYSWSFEQDVLEYARHGMGGIGVWRSKLTDFGIAKGAEMVRDHGLQVTSLQWAGGFTGSDGRSYDDALVDAAELIEMAAMIESPCLIVHSGARGGHTHNHASRLFRMALEQLLPRAEEHNVALAIEPMHPGCAWEWTLLKTLEDTAEILQQFPSPHLQLVYDMYHFPAPPQPLLEVLLPRMAIVQLGDACQPPHGEQNRCPLGEGEVPLGSLVCELEALGYTGFYEVELRGEDVEALTYRELVDQSVEMFEHLMSSREPGAR
ncbi:MAG: sugar phosphate isomerase/epimerase [Planctomycetales bacterium]|nr:sugar phosphate isomerase/epimerase [Planctomycetales bacterium]